MLLIETLISPFFFSVRIPGAYQVAEASPLPPPSTIGGAFAYSYALWKGVNFLEALEIFAKNSWYYAIPIGDIVFSSIILRRSRLLQVREPFVRRPDDWKRVIDALPPDLKEQMKKHNLLDRSKLRYRHDFLRILRTLKHEYYWKYYTSTFFDAMIRRYVFTNGLYIAGIIPIEEAFPLVSTRLGDTESYIGVKRISVVNQFRLQKISTGIIRSPSYAPISYGDKRLLLPKGDWPIQLLTWPRYLLDRLSKHKKPSRNVYISPVVLPLRREIRRINGKDIEVFIPSEIVVEIRSEVYVLEYDSSLLNTRVKIIVPTQAIFEE